jgi:hypothetical protein
MRRGETGRQAKPNARRDESPTRSRGMLSGFIKPVEIIGLSHYTRKYRISNVLKR